MVGHAHPECGEAEFIQQFAEADVAFGVRVPLRENDDGAALGIGDREEARENLVVFGIGAFNGTGECQPAGREREIGRRSITIELSGPLGVPG